MIFGVLSSQKILAGLKKGKIYSGLQYLAEEAFNENAKLIVFSPDGVDWWEKCIYGLAYNRNKKRWISEKCPFPEIIYDRSIFPPVEKEAGKFARNRFKDEYHLPFLNTRHYFPKWETYRVLLERKDTRKYLPDTILYKHPIYLTRFLSKYPSVYIKDSGGSRGKNIFKVQHNYEGQFLVTYYENGKNQYKMMNLKNIYKTIIEGSLSGKKIVLQRGIDLANVWGKPFDIRILVQKNASGEWEIVDKSLRIASDTKSAVTNVSSGGEVKKFSEIIPRIFPISAQRINSELEKMVLNICFCLESKYGLLGELGIDAALDKRGNLWLLEVNGKPAKTCIRRSNDKALIHKAYNNIIKYCQYLVESKK